MKILVFAISFLLIETAAIAQQNHFVYIQSDNKLPFYVKLNDKLYSSSAAGYAIIPKLQKATYDFVIGFPKNEWPQQNIAVEVNGDAGFMLKNFNEKGWGLYNIQTMNVSMANGKVVNNTVAINKPQEDNFTNTLSGVVNTPITTTVENTKSGDTPIVASAPQVIDPNTSKSTTSSNNTNVTHIQDIPLAGNTQGNLNANVAKPSTKENIAVVDKVIDNAGSAMVYLDNNGKDTIRVFIPAESNNEKPIASTKLNSSTVVNNDKIDGGLTAKPKTDKKFLDIELENPNKNTSVDTSASNSNISIVPPIPTNQQASLPVEPVNAMNNEATIKTEERKIEATESLPSKLTFNSDCKVIASNDDFLKIRKRMASENTEDDMVYAAKKLFKAKCYSTQQIQNLSVLFLSDKGKYNFFDAAYPFIHDPHNFGSLQSQLVDPYYVSRFKAMIRQ